ncbi:putative nrd1 protein [Eutypa lata UCREL1]|uniref:Putative nrd1 protein n=1 Tax=Eutypa lata (strain UCR-EL1) TaxID=1287681 RepID=M7SN20_EUTLA|nr:putative nrd1 protein [Eutypa lata UCREL1]
MLTLKPPGVSGSKIQSLTTLCVENVQYESALIQKIYTHFKKAPGTHKLGVLYVVDSVTRRWVDHAKQQGQQINNSAPDGTYACGVNRVTELLPVLMNDIIQNAPTEQKEKIKKLVDIWEKGQTFPISLIESFKQKLSAPPGKNDSTTPIGSPPPGPGLPGLAEAKASATTEAPNAIMEALANIARQNITAAPSSNATPAPAAAYNMPGIQPGLVPPTTLTPTPAQNQAASSTSFSSAPPVNAPGMPFQFSQFSQPPAQSPALPVSANAPHGFPGIVAPGAASAPPAAGMDPNLQQQVMLIQLLASQGVPYDKIPALVASMQSNTGAAPVPQTGQPPYSASWGQDGYHMSIGQDHVLQCVTGIPLAAVVIVITAFMAWVDFDRTIPTGHIKVLSRTLFVGGVTCPESELRGVFNRHGQVQTCIVNKDKRHAFVKMVTRRDAVTAKEAMESGSYRTRWGVGFGPRDCSDYQTGISVIPINKLTEADRKWMLTAEFGGSGGRAIETGLVVEEPDIEIGAGVSSKAISRRMQTDRGGRNGPKSSRGPGGDDDSDLTRWRRGRDPRRDERHDDTGFVNNNGGNQPAVPEFPFGISAGPNGMPMFPPGFAFPPPDQS